MRHKHRTTANNGSGNYPDTKPTSTPGLTCPTQRHTGLYSYHELLVVQINRREERPATRVISVVGRVSDSVRLGVFCVSVSLKGRIVGTRSAIGVAYHLFSRNSLACVQPMVYCASVVSVGRGRGANRRTRRRGGPRTMRKKSGRSRATRRPVYAGETRLV